MNVFGRASRANLASAHHWLQKAAHIVLRIKDHSVIKGHRPEVEQNAAFESGTSQLKWPHGKHNGIPSTAIDVQTWPRPAPLTFDGNPEKMSQAELRREVKRLRKLLSEQPLREDQIYLLGIYRGVLEMLEVPARTGADWDRDGEIADNGFDDFFHVEIDE